MDWKMGNILPGLYVGNFRDSQDQQQLEKFKITHIVAIHENPSSPLPDKHYLCVIASDSLQQNLSQYFSVCNDFIHEARLREGNVLVHCLAGMSRSVTVAVAYIMTVTNLSWEEALKVVRAGRAVGTPNLGFQHQLQEFEKFQLNDERYRLRERFPSCALEELDNIKCRFSMDKYNEMLQNRNQNNESVSENTVRNGSVSYTINFIVDKWKSRTFKQKDSVINSKLEHKSDPVNKNEIPKNRSGEALMTNVIYYKPIDVDVNDDNNIGEDATTKELLD